MNIRLVASTDGEIDTYSDQFLGLKTIFDETKFPYWVLVENQTVMGLIVAAQEPRELLQPASTTFIQIYLFRHQPDAVNQILSEAQTIASKHEAAYLSCIVNTEKQETIQLLEKAEFDMYDETLKMGVPLQNITPPETNLSFYRASPNETNLILENMLASMKDTPGRLLQTVIHNIRSLPSDQLESTLSQMEVVLVHDETHTVGFLSLEGPTIGMLGVHPIARGKGIGHTITQWAKSHLAEQGHFRAWLRVSVANPRALHILEKEGFKVNEQMRYYVKANPALWKDIPS